MPFISKKCNAARENGRKKKKKRVKLLPNTSPSNELIERSGPLTPEFIASGNSKNNSDELIERSGPLTPELIEFGNSKNNSEARMEEIVEVPCNETASPRYNSRILVEENYRLKICLNDVERRLEKEKRNSNEWKEQWKNSTKLKMDICRKKWKSKYESIRKSTSLSDKLSSKKCKKPYSSMRNRKSKHKKCAEVLDLIKKSIGELDISAFMKDFVKFLNKSEDQAFTTEISLLDAVFFKSKLRMTLAQLEQLKRYLKAHELIDFVPSVKKITAFTKAITLVDFYQVTQGVDVDGKKVTIVQAKNVIELIRTRVQHLSETKKYVDDEMTGNNLLLSITGDKGSTTTKIFVAIGNVPKPNSAKHLLLVGIFNAADTNRNIRNFLGPIFEQIDQLTSLKFLENGIIVTKDIRLMICGDLHFLCEMIDHKKQSSSFFCIFCEFKNLKGAKKTKMRDFDPRLSFKKRTIESYFKYSKTRCKTGYKGVRRGQGPILKNVPIQNYIPPPIHTKMGVMMKYIVTPVCKFAIKLDNTTRFEIFDTKKTTLKKAGKIIEMKKKRLGSCQPSQKSSLEKELLEMRKEYKQLEKIWEGVPNGRLKRLEKAWNDVGASRNVYFQAFNGNDCKRILTPFGVQKTFSVFTDVMSDHLRAIKDSMEALSTCMALSVARVLSSDEQSEMKRAIARFAHHVARANPEETITQKMHILLHHVPEYLDANGSWAKLSEQGTEAAHVLVNELMRRYCSTKNMGKKMLLIVREMLSWNFTSDFERIED